MSSWKKVLVSGSSIEVNQISASGVPTTDNESNLLVIDSNGSITQMDQSNVAGTNPTFNIEAINVASSTISDFDTGADYLIFSASEKTHGFGFTHTTSGNTSSIALQTPQGLKTDDTPTFTSVKLLSIQNSSQPDVNIKVGSNDIILSASGKPMLTLNTTLAQDQVIVNDAGNDIDFRVAGNTDTQLFLVDAANNAVAIGTTVDTNSLLKVAGNINVSSITASALPTNTDSITVVVDGGSGKLEKRDISSAISGAIDAATASFSASIIGTANEIGVTTDGSGNIVIGLTDDVTIPSDLTVTDNLDLTGGNVTISGNISASGDITASNIRVDNDIALGGNIFSFSGFSFIEGVSANFTGSNVFGSGSAPAANDIAGGGTAHQFTGSVAITGSGLTIIAGGVTATDNTGSFGYLTAPEISSSGNLFASLSNDDTAITDGVVVYDNATGQFFTTSSLSLSVTTFKATGQRDGNSAITGSLHLKKSTGNILKVGDIDASGGSGGALGAAAVKSGGSSTAGGLVIQHSESNKAIVELGQLNGHGSIRVSDSASNGAILFSASGSHSYINTNKNFGVGTSNATERLTVDGNITTTGHITASGAISASGNLFAKVVNNDTTSFKTVVYDPTTGKFHSTGSYGGGGATGDYTTLNNIPSGIISGSTFSSNNQGGITASINGITSSFDVGLTIGDSPTFNTITATGDISVAGTSTLTGNTTIEGDLIVNGNTTTIATTNLAIEDTFILLGSGSAGDGSLNNGGIIVEQTAAGLGVALYWDTTAQNWAIDKEGADHTSATGNVSADINVATIQLVAGNGTTPTSSPIMGVADNANQKGHFYVDTSDAFGLYVYT